MTQEDFVEKAVVKVMKKDVESNLAIEGDGNDKVFVFPIHILRY